MSLRKLTTTYNPYIATYARPQPADNLFISARLSVPSAVSFSKCGRYSSPEEYPRDNRDGTLVLTAGGKLVLNQIVKNQL